MARRLYHQQKTTNLGGFANCKYIKDKPKNKNFHKENVIELAKKQKQNESVFPVPSQKTFLIYQNGEIKDGTSSCWQISGYIPH